MAHMRFFKKTISTAKLTALTVAAGLALVGLSACSVIAQNDTDTSTGETEKSEAKTVTVITHDSFALSDEAIAEFEKATGYKLVTTAPGDAGTVLNQLKLQAGTPSADAFFGIDNFSVFELLEYDVLAKTQGATAKLWNAEGITDEIDPEADLYDPGFSKDENSGDAVPIDRGDVCLNVDNEWFKEKGLAAPASFDDIIKPEYKDLTVITNPASSSPGYAMLVGTHALYGEDGVADYWEKLFANGVKVADGWSQAYYTDFTGGAEESGTRPIVLSYASSPAESEGATSSLDATCVRQIEYAGVLKGAENPEGARAFITFMLSETVQSEIPEQMYMYPERKAAKLPEAWAKYAKLTDSPIKVNDVDAGAKREQWISAWTELFEAQAQ